MAKRKDQKRTRNDLISLVRYGNLKPGEAEEIATARGWPPFAQEPPLPAFDPMQVSQWSIVMAIAWIARRDIGLVREQQPDFRAECTHWLFRHWRGPTESGTAFKKHSGWFLETYRPPTTARLTLSEVVRDAAEPSAPKRMSIREAEASLWRALSDGALVAIGLDQQRKPTDIPQRDWAYLKLFERAEPRRIEI